LQKVEYKETTKGQTRNPHTEFQANQTKRLLAQTTIRVTTNRFDAPPEGYEEEGGRPKK